MKPKPPAKDVEITLVITETTAGKLSINTSIPDHADGTIALVMAQMAMDAMRRAMLETTGQNPPLEETRLQ